MDRIHRKSALGETSPLLQVAHDAGAELLWTRYEQQLPLCAFTSNGLNCRKCFQGPCRINPFGDEPTRGVCGADRDQIVMENLFQATLEGVMESARTAWLLGNGETDREFPDVADAWPSGTKERLARSGLLPVRPADAFTTQNGFFTHKGFLSQTLRDLTRLGLINYGLLSRAAASLPQAEAGPELHPDGVNILIVGQGPSDLSKAIQRQAAQRAPGKRVNLFTQGAHRLPLSMTAADHGSPELALGMYVDAVIIAPNAGCPGVEALATRYRIPALIIEAETSVDEIALAALEQAARHVRTASPGARVCAITSANAREASRLPRAEDLQRAVQSGRVRGMVVLFGEANPKQAFFDRTLTLMEAVLAERAMILVGGDLGAQADALAGELGRRPSNQRSAFAADMARDGVRPIVAFGSAFELPAVVALLNSLTWAQGAATCPVAFAFPEFYRAATWASAVTLFSLGFTIQIGARLPFWGSPWVAETLIPEWRKITGGTLLAGPVVPEPRAQAEELTAILKAGKGR